MLAFYEGTSKQSDTGFSMRMGFHWLLCVLALSIVYQTDVWAQAGLLTVGAGLEEMRSVGSDLMDKGQSTGNHLFVDAAIQVQAIVDRLNTILADDITKPIDDLDTSLKQEFTKYLGKSFFKNGSWRVSCSHANSENGGSPGV